MVRPIAVTVVIAVALLVVSGAGGAPAQMPKPGGTLVIGTRTASEPACLNVLLVACDLPLLLEQILPGAFKVWPDATYRPDLASARIVGRKPFVLVYDIRPEARWSDGVAVTARDFLFTHQAMLREGNTT